MVRLGSKKYRQIQADLEGQGVTSCITRIDAHAYNLIINFKIEKVYKVRRSANKYLEKLLNCKTK